MNRFFVCALPRSGTAWTSMLFNMVEDTFCWHEVIQHGDRFNSMEEAMSLAPIVGDCTTYTGEEFDPMEGRRAFIVRDSRECERSYVKAMGSMAAQSWPFILMNSQRWIAKHKPLMVYYSNLFSRDRTTAFEECQRLVLHCTGKQLRYEAWLQVSDLHIQINNLCPEHYHGRTFIRSIHPPHALPGCDRGEGQ